MKPGNQMLSICDDAIARTADVVGEHHFHDIELFAAHLRGLGNLTNDQAMQKLCITKIPGDFRHVRFTIYEVITEGRNGEIMLGEAKGGGAMIDPMLQPLELYQLVHTALLVSDMSEATSNGQGEWLDTFALPIKNPGVLELGLVLKPRGTKNWQPDS